MTPEEFTRKLPPLANSPASTKPPFVFKNLSVRVFPLRASLDALQQVCDSYLNFVPAEVGRFRAVVPYVYMSLLDYGQISEMVDSIGWFAQAEVYFGVPVEWYKLVNGKWVFHDWAVITPFIYVDDDFSAPLGRAVFGFPKTLASIVKTKSEWLQNAVGPVTVASVQTKVFPELYKGKSLEARVFLEIERAAPMSNLRIPPDPASPIAPWNIATNFAEAMAGFGRDAMRLAQFMRIFEPNPASSPAFPMEMMNRLGPALQPGGKGFTLNSLNLKQFRSADLPFHFCYQALTNGGMQVMAFNGGGLMGEERTILGDLSGGYTVKLSEYSSLPIAQTLGLEVERRWQGDGVKVAVLKPVMPFWISVNAKYLEGENLAWRTRDGIWYRGNGDVLSPSQKPVGPKDDSTLFNTSVASAVDDAVTGPFQFTGTTIRVLPLLAKRAKLQDFLDKTYINDQLLPGAVSKDRTTRKNFRLALWSRPPSQVNEGPPIGGDHAYVYVTATSFGGVTSKTNDVGDWAKYELSFLIPVKFECQSEGGKWEVQGVGLVPAYSFVDDSAAAVARTEVQGIPTLRANFKRPENVWLQEGEANFGSRQTVLRVDSEVFTAFHVGQQAVIEPILEISARDDGSTAGQWDSQVNPATWAELQRLELGTKNGAAVVNPEKYNLVRSLALEILGNRVPIALYTLKQFPDVADPGKACYQALVRVSRVFDEVFDCREIEETLRVCIHDFPSLSLVDKLGIVANTVGQGAGVTYEAHAIRPFYIRATVREELGEQLLSRSGDSEWQYSEHVFEGLLGNDGGDDFAVDRAALAIQDDGDPSHMNAALIEATQRRAGQGSIAKIAVREALVPVDPQMVIESVLSREWGNFDENARWRKGCEDVLKARELILSNQPGAFAAFKLKDPQMIRNAVALVNDAAAQNESAVARIQEGIQRATVAGWQMFADCEEQLYRSVLQQKAHIPGRRRVHKQVEPMILRMKEFTMARLEMEHHFSVLAAWSISRAIGAADPLPTDELANASSKLIDVLKVISGLLILGEPLSSGIQIVADATRLRDLLTVLHFAPAVDFGFYVRGVPGAKGLPDAKGADAEKGSLQDSVAFAVRLIEQFREAVQLGTKACIVQRDALVNKLSKAYQKPDFCIRRDSVGLDCDQLLPKTLSWDDDWYAGRDIHAAIYGENEDYSPQ